MDRRMKKLFVLLLSAVMVTGLLAGCGSKEASADAQEGATTFTVGFDAEFPPYGYMDENG